MASCLSNPRNPSRRKLTGPEKRVYELGHARGEQDARSADVGIHIDNDTSAIHRNFNFYWERLLSNGETKASQKSVMSAAFERGYYDGLARRRNPLFLPKSLFDSYIVKSSDGSITVDRIQTLNGAERKVRELSRKYPCVGFDITSAKHGSVIKSYSASVGKGAPKVETDNTREYKQEVAEDVKKATKYRLYVGGKEYATYDTRKEAERYARDRKVSEGMSTRIKEVVGNPRKVPSFVLSFPGTIPLFESKSLRGKVTHVSGRDDLPVIPLQWMKIRGGPRRALIEVPYGRINLYGWVDEDQLKHANPLTGVPSHDIPLEMRHGRSQQQAIAIALEEQRRRHPSKAYPRPNPYPVRWYIQTGPAYHDRVDFREDQLKQANEFAQNLANETGKAVTRQEYGRTGGSLFYPKTKRGKKNPEGDESDTQAAAELYEQFHGVEPTGEVVYTETTEVPDSFAELGDLVELCVATVHGKDATIAAPDPEDGNLQTVVKLASSPDGRQLYLIGGDQSLDLEKLGFAESEERHHMLIGTLYQITYRTKKKFHKMRMTDYFHNLGEESGLQPALTYNPYNERMGITGGNYLVKPEGVVD
jgi:hypothetical protein